MKLILPLTALLAVMTVVAFRGRAAEHSSTRDGVYTAEQADSGRAGYRKSCASCHRESLMGSGATAPALAGEDFMAEWTGQTADDLFEKIQTTMPADHPGTLSREQNADILAYILQVNKLPAGKNRLPSDEDALKQIQIEGPKE